MSFIEQLKAIWSNHGTKVLGFGGMVLSTLSLLDHETINLIGVTFGPLWGPRVTHGLAVLGGVMTVRRGMANSQPKP